MQDVFKNIDAKKLAGFIKQVDFNFHKLATNQLYIQENQVEFEQYLKKILKNQAEILLFQKLSVPEIADDT